jgi:hypothetical protein
MHPADWINDMLASDLPTQVKVALYEIAPLLVACPMLRRVILEGARHTDVSDLAQAECHLGPDGVPAPGCSFLDETSDVEV